MRFISFYQTVSLKMALPCDRYCAGIFAYFFSFFSSSSLSVSAYGASLRLSSDFFPVSAALSTSSCPFSAFPSGYPDLWASFRRLLHPPGQGQKREEISGKTARIFYTMTFLPKLVKLVPARKNNYLVNLFQRNAFQEIHSVVFFSTTCLIL